MPVVRRSRCDTYRSSAGTVDGGQLSIGAQYRLSAKTAFQAGFFTDFFRAAHGLIDELHAHMTVRNDGWDFS